MDDEKFSTSDMIGKIEILIEELSSKTSQYFQDHASK